MQKETLKIFVFDEINVGIKRRQTFGLSEQPSFLESIDLVYKQIFNWLVYFANAPSVGGGLLTLEFKSISA